LDANLSWMDRIPFKDASYKTLLDQCNIITVESKKLKQYLSQRWPYKIDYVPNGTDDSSSRKRTEYHEKENVILTIGRIGTQQKANEVLLEAFKAVADAIPSWTVKLVGS